MTESDIEKQHDHGILLLDKEEGISSFDLIRRLKRISREKKIGHGGTLDPFATGLVVCFIGRQYTRMSQKLLDASKSYECVIKLGAATDSYDLTGQITQESTRIVSFSELEEGLKKFQGSFLQTPPMFSAKRINGQRLYKLARQGHEIDRVACPVFVKLELCEYTYPHVHLRVHCSKGTYIRTLAHDIGLELKSYGHLVELRRTRVGPFLLRDALDAREIMFEKDLQTSRSLMQQYLKSQWPLDEIEPIISLGRSNLDNNLKGNGGSHG